MKFLVSFFLIKWCYYIIICVYKDVYGYIIIFRNFIKFVLILFRVEYLMINEGKLSEV